MHRAARPTALLALAAGAACLTLWAGWWAVRSGPPARPPAPPFRDLGAVLVRYSDSRWEVAAPPRRPGPYRDLGGSMLGRGDTSRRLTSRVRDESGAVVEEVSLTADTDCDQMVVELETQAGQRTLVTLKRCR